MSGYASRYSITASRSDQSGRTKTAFAAEGGYESGQVMFVAGKGYEVGGGVVGRWGWGMKGGMGESGRRVEKRGRMRDIVWRRKVGGRVRIIDAQAWW